MIKKLLPLSLLMTTVAFAVTPCEQQLGSMLDGYKQMGKAVQSYQIKDCSTLAPAMGSVFDENSDTNAPEVTSSAACAVLFSFGESSLPELMVIDQLNNFQVQRHFDSTEHRLDLSLYGDQQSGTILFIDLMGSDGDIDYVTRANYDMHSDSVRLVKWKVGWIFNSYSHDYTLQCR